MVMLLQGFDGRLVDDDSLTGHVQSHMFPQESYLVWAAVIA